MSQDGLRGGGVKGAGAERYDVERELARGGMGRVLAARDTLLERRVALKVLLDPRPHTVARLVEEAQLTGQLAHPGIVPLHELGGSGRDVYLVMKLVEGRSMKELVDGLAAGEARTTQRYGMRSLLRLFLEVCEAVAFAHDRGVVHRDLKPANVMVGPSDEVLVLDWGVAKPIASGAGATVPEDVAEPGPRGTVRSTVRELAAARAAAARMAAGDTAGDLTQSEGIIGTPAYMAPEQAGGEVRIDRRADVYALGATLYELLTLRPPFAGGAMEVVMKLLAEPPPRPSEAAPGRAIPPALESIVLRAMARSRDERYPDARALARDVERWLDDLPVEAHQETTREAVARLVSRHRIPAITALLALLVLVVGGLVARATVKAEQARLERETLASAAAGRDADAAARAAASAAETGRRAARALDAVTPTPSILEGFARAADAVLILDRASRPGTDVADPQGGEASAAANVRRLSEAHSGARKKLDGVLAALDDLRVGPADPAVDPCADEVRAARATLDRELLEVYLGRAPEAVLAATRGSELAPGAAWAQVARVRALRRLARFTAAAEEAARLPEDGGRDEACAAAVRALKAAALERPAEERERLTDLALKHDPGAAWLLVQRAEARAQRGRFDAASDDYDQAIRLRRLDAWAHTSRLVNTYHLGYRENMYADQAGFAEYLAPSNVDGRLFVGKCRQWSAQGERYETPIEVTLAGLAKVDALAAGRAQAEIALLGDQREEAERAARAVLAAQPDDRVGLAVLAEVQRRRGALDEAQATAELGLVRHPADPALQRARGRVALDQGQTLAAIPWLADGAPSSLDSSDWAVLALAYAESSSPDDWEKGVSAARRGLAVDVYDMHYYNPEATPIPGDPRLHRALGRLRLKQGKPAAAAAHFARAFVFAVMMNHPQRNLGRRDRQDALACGEAHEALGLPAEAAVWYSQAAEDPTLTVEAQRRLTRLGRR